MKASNEDCPMDEPDEHSPILSSPPSAAAMAASSSQQQQDHRYPEPGQPREHQHSQYHHHSQGPHPGHSGSRPHSPEHPHHHPFPNNSNGPTGQQQQEQEQQQQQHYPQEQQQQHQPHPDHHRYPESSRSYGPNGYPQDQHNSHNNPNHGHPHHPHPQPQHYPPQQQQAPYYYPPGQQHGAPTSPSPPLPTSAEGFQGRPLPPIEPSHPLHNYMSTSRRGSLTDAPEYPGDGHRRPSTSTMESTSAGYYSGNNSHNNSANTTPGGQDGRHYANSSAASSNSSTPSDPHYLHQQQQPQQQPPPPHGPNSPLQHLRPSAESGRRESLPSIYSSAGPLGQLLSQEPARRHSIAHSDALGGPLKRKTSTTPLSQVYSSETVFDHHNNHPSKRRDSIPDAGLPSSSSSSTHPYPARNSYSAPSSPPRRGSVPHGGPVPVLNLQPAAEIRPSYPPEHPHRSHLPLHQPRRPSLLSDVGSRRSSLAEVHHPYHMPSHRDSPQQNNGQQQDYDHHMNVNMERMHLSNHRGSLGGEPPLVTNGRPGPNGSPGEGHVVGTVTPASNLLHPGYPAGYATDGDNKGETPYSRSPELRVSHKLAERKRRKEMKELFDELRDSLPVDRSLKTSKWEILSKAVDFIAGIKANHEELNKEVEMLRREVARLNQQ